MISAKRMLKWGANLLAGLLLATIVATGVVKYTVGWFWTIPQNGMYPTLPAGQAVFGINNLYKNVENVKRGDIVVFWHYDGGNRYIYIWRVVGLPGDSVEIDNVRVIVNGKDLPREKIRSEEGLDILRETNGVVSYEVAYDRTASAGLPQALSLSVPVNHLYVMGDNRQHARDSRLMGPIPFGSVIARKW